jgi:hypothetical protein
VRKAILPDDAAELLCVGLWSPHPPNGAACGNVLLEPSLEGPSFPFFERRRTKTTTRRREGNRHEKARKDTKQDNDFEQELAERAEKWLAIFFLSLLPLLPPVQFFFLFLRLFAPFRGYAITLRR